MTREQFIQWIDAIPYGKRLPTALYILRPEDWTNIRPGLAATVERAALAAKSDPAWNLLKLHTDQIAISFLSYPNFDTDPHPALAEATRINLNTGTVVRTDYRKRSNPPILHRKETFLPPDHPRLAAFAALTKQEEEAGLYRDTSRIGLRLHWQTLLSRLGLFHDGHALVRTGKMPTQIDLQKQPQVPERLYIRGFDLPHRDGVGLSHEGRLPEAKTFSRRLAVLFRLHPYSGPAEGRRVGRRDQPAPFDGRPHPGERGPAEIRRQLTVVHQGVERLGLSPLVELPGSAA
jgi:hypothetical protein